MAFGALLVTLFDLSLAVSKLEKSWCGFSSCFLLLVTVPDGKQYIRFAFPFQSCFLSQGLNVVVQFVLPLPFSSLHHPLRENYQRAAFVMVDLWRVGYQYSGKPRVTPKQGDTAFMLQTFAVRFLLFSSTMKIWIVLIVWCRVLLWQKYSRARSLRMTHEMVQN